MLKSKKIVISLVIFYFLSFILSLVNTYNIKDIFNFLYTRIIIYSLVYYIVTKQFSDDLIMHRFVNRVDFIMKENFKYLLNILVYILCILIFELSINIIISINHQISFFELAYIILDYFLKLMILGFIYLESILLSKKLFYIINLFAFIITLVSNSFINTNIVLLVILFFINFKYNLRELIRNHYKSIFKYFILFIFDFIIIFYFSQYINLKEIKSLKINEFAGIIFQNNRLYELYNIERILLLTKSI